MGPIPNSMIPFYRLLLPTVIGSLIVSSTITYTITGHVLKGKKKPTTDQKDIYKAVKTHLVMLVFGLFSFMLAGSLVEFCELQSDIFSELQSDIIMYIYMGLMSLMTIFVTSYIIYAWDLEQHFGVKALNKR